MHEFHELVTSQEKSKQQPKRIVQVISEPFYGSLYFSAAPANFGTDLAYSNVDGEMVLAMPFDACKPLTNGDEVKGRVAVVVRSGCMFQEKAKHAQEKGAIAVIVLDNNLGSTFEPFFAMSGEENQEPSDIAVPVVLLFNVDGQKLIGELKKVGELRLRVAELVGNPAYYFNAFLRNPKKLKQFVKHSVALALLQNPIYVDFDSREIQFNFHFGTINADSDAEEKQRIVEENVENLAESLKISKTADRDFVLNVARTLAYGELGFGVTASEQQLLRLARLLPEMSTIEGTKVQNPVVTVKCSIDDSSQKCNRV